MRSRHRWLLAVNLLTFLIAGYSILQSLLRAAVALGVVEVAGTYAVGPYDIAILFFFPGPVWSWFDSNGFRRGEIARRSRVRRLAYWVTGLPGVVLLAYVGVAAIVAVALVAVVLLLIAGNARREEQIGIVEEGVRRAIR